MAGLLVAPTLLVRLVLGPLQEGVEVFPAIEPVAVDGMPYRRKLPRTVPMPERIRRYAQDVGRLLDREVASEVSR
jgi:hypothetical protein